MLSGEPFAHDVAAGRRFAPNNVEQLRSMAAAGVEIGAHTYTHPDVARITDEAVLHREVVEAGQELAELIRRPVRYFAFPSDSASISAHTHSTSPGRPAMRRSAPVTAATTSPETTPFTSRGFPATKN